MTVGPSWILLRWWGAVAAALCIGLFLSGLLNGRGAPAASSLPDLHPLERALLALQHENAELQRENTALRASANVSASASDMLMLRRENTMLKAREHALRASLAAAGGKDSQSPRPAEGSKERAIDALRRSTQSVEFTKERATTLAQRGALLLTFVNKIRLDFAATWVAHVRRLGLSNWLVGATDRTALTELLRARTPCFDMRTNLPEGEWPWGSPSFKSLGPHKIELIFRALSWGLEVVITDIDALVLRDPFPYMARWPDAGFLTTSDHLHNTTSDGGLENHRSIHTAFNIGFMFFRPSALPLVEEWRRAVLADPKSRWDQGEFNRLARHGWDTAKTAGLSDRRLFWSYEGRVIGGVLPLALFCGGHNYFVSQFAQRAGSEVYSIHTTYQYGGAAGKRHRLREAMVWEDPPEYYNASVLAFEPSLDPSLLAPAGGMDARGHVALIKHQLRQLRSALLLAHALGRKLVLPRVVCGYDKYWGPLDRGVIPGTHLWALPIRSCPLDHYLEPQSLSPTETLREHSFLSNPRVAASFRASAANTTFDPDGGDAEWKRLRAVGAKVLRVTNLATVDTRESAAIPEPARKQFDLAFAHAHGSWCCAPVEESKRGAPRSARFNLLRS